MGPRYAGEFSFLSVDHFKRSWSFRWAMVAYRSGGGGATGIVSRRTAVVVVRSHQPAFFFHAAAD